MLINQNPFKNQNSKVQSQNVTNKSHSFVSNRYLHFGLNTFFLTTAVSLIII